MVRIVVIPIGLIVAFLGMADSSAWGQRVQMPTPVTGAPPATATTVAGTGSTAPGIASAPVASGGIMTAQAPSPTPTYAPSAGANPLGAVSGAAPGYTAPAAGTGATFQGGIQTAPSSWDPYATPGLQGPTLLSQDPTLPAAPAWPAMSVDATKFLQEIRGESTWLAGLGNSSKPLGVNDLTFTGKFAIPLCSLSTPLLVTPGFGFHFWNGPVTTPTQLADLPPRTYDAFIDTAWQPQITPGLSADLDVNVGVYSDSRRVTTQSIRIKGRALAVVGLSPSIEIRAGIFYLDRVEIKMLPAGGVVWTPNSDTRFEILFPNPRLAHRWNGLDSSSGIDWWWYVRGEYGGGTWTVKRLNGVNTNEIDTVDYDDIRIAVGLEGFRPTGRHGRIEVGVAFDRRLYYYEHPEQTYTPSTTIFLGGGLAY